MQIVYRPGKSNGNADGLSRQDWDDEEDSTQSEAGLGVDQMPATGSILGGGGELWDHPPPGQWESKEEGGRN